LKGQGMEQQRLVGRVAIITGGGRGIGKAVALAYAREGADVAVVARSADEIKQTAAEIEALGRRALAVPADVSKPEAVNHMVLTVLKAFDRIDILFNAAGARAVAPSAELVYADWQRVLAANLTGSFLCSQRVYAPMKNAGGGKIIMVGSMQAHSGAPFRAAYVSSKTGLVEIGRAHV
jgi:NAD(P)-dependent dehydrogenase (short-subunit alcohol dehydrogenase family)